MRVERCVLLQPAVRAQYRSRPRPLVLLQRQHLLDQLFGLPAHLLLLIEILAAVFASGGSAHGIRVISLLHLLLLLRASVIEAGAGGRREDGSSVRRSQVWPIRHERISTRDVRVIRQHAGRLQAERAGPMLVLRILLLGAERVDALRDLAVQVLFLRRFEGHLPSQHDKEQHAARPDIRRRAPVILLVHDLGGHIAWRAAEDAQFLLRDAGKAEINDLHLMRPRVVHDVLWFEIPVADVFTVSEGQGLQNLVQDDGDCGLSHEFLGGVVQDWTFQVDLLPLGVDPGANRGRREGELGQVVLEQQLLDVAVEHLTLNELQDYVQLLGRVDHIVHAHDVGVLELLHDGDLALDADFALALLIQFELLIDLDCKDQASWFMRRHFDRGIGAGAEVFADLVVSDLGVVARTVVALLGSLRQHDYLVQHLLLRCLIRRAKLIVRVKFLVELVPEGRPRKLLFGAQLALTVGDSLLLD